MKVNDRGAYRRFAYDIDKFYFFLCRRRQNVRPSSRHSFLRLNCSFNGRKFLKQKVEILRLNTSRVMSLCSVEK